MERALFAFERLMLGGGRPYPIGLVARVEGELDRDALRSALDWLQRRHPILACAIVERDRRPWVVEQHPAPPIPLRIVESSPGTRAGSHWRDALPAEAARGLPRAQGPLARLTWIRHPSWNELILVADHAVCDGLSVVILLRDLLAHLAGTQDGLAAPAQPATLRALVGPPPRALRLLAPLISIVGTPLLRVYAARTRRHRLTPPRGDFHVRSWDMAAGDAARLRARARAQGVSAYDAIAAAWLRAARSIFPGGEFRALLSPNDVRRLLAVKGRDLLFPVTANVTLQLPDAAADASPGALWDAARALRADATAARSRLRLARFAHLAECLHGVVDAAVATVLFKDARSALTYSHFGEVALTDPGASVIAATPLAAFAGAPWATSTTIASLISDGIWRFCLIAREDVMTPAEAERLCRHAMEDVMAAASAPA